MAIPKGLDTSFIKRAMESTSFNVTAADFVHSDLKYKREIQYLFALNFFPKFDTTAIPKDLNVNVINKLIRDLKQISSTNFNKLYGYNLKGIGPGEVMLFFLIGSAALGGGSSAAKDVVLIGGKSYEVKAAKISTDNYAYDFKLGGTVPISDIMTNLSNLSRKVNGPGSSQTEINVGMIQKISQKAPVEYKSIVDAYASVAYDKYFKNHEIIFLNNNESMTSKGLIAGVKSVKKSDVILDRMTSGTIKPKVKL